MRLISLIFLLISLDLVNAQMFKLLQARNLAGLLQTLNDRRKARPQKQRSRVKPGLFIRRY